MAATTATEVFDFMKTETVIRTNNTTQVTALLARVTNLIEKYIGRKITDTAFVINVHDGRFCSILGNELWLEGIYRDTHSITEIKEEDVLLVKQTAFDDDNDYVEDFKKGLIERIGSIWSSAKFAIKITGKCGLVDPATPANTLGGIKQILIEEVAVKSGLWQRIFNDGEGNEFETDRQSLTPQTRNRLDSYILPVIP